MMSQSAPDEVLEKDARAAARSTLYSTFAKALSHPSDEVLAAFTSGKFESDVQGLMALAGYEPCVNGLPGISGEPRDIDLAYATAFEAGLPKVSLREVNYVREGEKVLFEDLFRFYDHFGLDTSSGTLREWPDHIAVELEFMHYLTWLEGRTQDLQSVTALRRAQQDFLIRHLGHWVLELADRLEQKAIIAPYPAVARLLAGFVAAESC
jgi:DMSO reductase family type II enzyme chaperone